MKPLAEREETYPTDLSTFWWEAEAAIKSIHPSLADMHNPVRFGQPHLANLGPLLLGYALWE